MHKAGKYVYYIASLYIIKKYLGTKKGRTHSNVTLWDYVDVDDVSFTKAFTDWLACQFFLILI